MPRITAGSKLFDNLLDGGYDADIITTIYGPAGSGKTLCCILCSINVARSGKKVIYIDTEGGFSVDRLMQVAPDYKKLLENIIFLNPTSFKSQKEAFEKIKDMINNRIGLIIVDTISMLYRIELGKGDSSEVNHEMGLQLSYLTDIARTKSIPVMITNQVYANFEDKNEIRMVGGDLLKYSSKCLIELQITPDNNRRAILRKHRSIEQGRLIPFKIVATGILGTKMLSL